MIQAGDTWMEMYQAKLVYYEHIALRITDETVELQEDLMHVDFHCYHCHQLVFHIYWL